MMTTFFGTPFEEDDSLKITILWTLKINSLIQTWCLTRSIFHSDQYNNNVDSNDLGASSGANNEGSGEKGDQSDLKGENQDDDKADDKGASPSDQNADDNNPQC